MIYLQKNCSIFIIMKTNLYLGFDVYLKYLNYFKYVYCSITNYQIQWKIIVALIVVRCMHYSFRYYTVHVINW